MSNKRQHGKGFVDFERKFIRSLSLVASIISLAGGVINFSLGFQLELLVMPIISAICFSIFFYWAGQNSHGILNLKIGLTAIAILSVNFLWYYNYGSYGPSPYFFVIIYSLLIFIWQGRQLVIVSSILVFNIICIFIIEYNHPGIIKNYESDVARIIDVYTGTLMYGLIIFVLVNSAKKSLQAEYEKAKRSDMLKSAFLANMSHEIRTPMNSIMGYSQLLRDMDLSESEKKFFLETINLQSEQLLSLINDIIDISKIEAGVINIREDYVKLNELVEEVYRSLLPLKREDIEFRIKGNKTAEGKVIISDRLRLKQIITNLANNALKFTYKGYVEIGYCIDEKMNLEISVKDTGTGIPQEELSKIFERFYQVDSKSKSVLNKGTGLGLAISRALAERMGGVITVESDENSGSVFTLKLPVKMAPPQLQSKQESERTDKMDFNKKTVLVVEDIISNFLFLKHALISMNCRVEWRENGEQAVHYIKNGGIADIILMDIKMPVMDGYEATREIKRIKPELIVIAQTAYAMEEDKNKAFDAGCDDYILKPIHIDELKDIMIKYL
jgi:signal transduction histidine kinase/CheY-like chemotaxis protein